MFENYVYPDSRGHFEEFGGKYVPEALLPALQELEQTYLRASKEDAFQCELDQLLQHYVGRPSPLALAPRISEELNFEVYLKREDLNHTGAHKINNALGQILLAKRMGKRRIIAETGAGQHGVATATVCARMNLECFVYMGAEDIRRQSLNVFRMELMGAKVIPVTSGTSTLKDATNEAIRDWVANVNDSYYLIGSVVGPHPYPKIVRDFQKIIGEETLSQWKKLGKSEFPDHAIACVGGGSNAIGMFYPMITTPINLIGVEASGLGIDSEAHAATMSKGSFGILHGSASYLLQNEHGQVSLPHSISAGLDYPGVGPEHAFLKKSGRVTYVDASDDEALEAFQWMSRLEGLLPALETAHAIAALKKNGTIIRPHQKVVLCLSGRGDKDVHTVAEALGKDLL
tara:strand:+ start:5825 stop:7027 length:1203 start_codon:yes stop_codon:yes gene_type:complete